MKQKFQINGISCGGCVARVIDTLEAHPNIEKAEIFLAPKGATVITMDKTLTVAELQKQLDKLKGYTINQQSSKI
ncbi:heavy-metal-associated domain-containing protein [Aequorivita marina]|uniref:heavy-metal-associated domain-containing protein n=1 Tax=Aequorivita marina TaxID=3073654 RepID=UPI002873FF97|nr:heavy-metal-associated domain-containing protein [Aequorivita sp. S2608]MDS1297033.1 heavy-metal-associated domain-containing protein [Aequorivita sp. S2608]